MIRFCAAVIFLLCAAGAISVARAQDAPSLPVVTEDNKIVEIPELTSVDFNDAFNTIENPFLSDLVKLNYQIGLLDKMVSRQAVIDQIGEVYEKMGVAYKQPLPALGVCKQLPPNAVCIKAYPDLYASYAQERRAYYEALEGQKNIDEGGVPQESAQEKAARLAMEDAIRREREEKASRKTRYQWTDITCRAGTCRGVLISPAVNGYRVTIRQGERLPDGTLIESISANGVSINIGGDKIAVRPAVTDTVDQTAAASANNVNTAETNTGAPTSAPTAQAVPAPAAVASNTVDDADLTSNDNVIADTAAAAPVLSGDTSGQNSIEPAIGPSGLF
jgi:hypothetical protein